MTNTPDNPVIGPPVTLADGGVWTAAQLTVGISRDGTASPGTLVVAASTADQPTTLEVSDALQVGQDGTLAGASATGTLDVTGGSEVSAAALGIAANATVFVDPASGIVLGTGSVTPASLVVGPGAALAGVSGLVIADVVLWGRLAVVPPAATGSDPGGALYVDGPLTGTGTISVGASLAPGGMLEIADAVAFAGTIDLAPGATLALVLGDAPSADLAMEGATVDLRGDPFGNGQTLSYDSGTGLLTISSVVSDPAELPQTAMLDVGTGYVAGDFAVSAGAAHGYAGPDTRVTMPQAVRAAPTGPTQPGTGGTSQTGTGGATPTGTGGGSVSGTGTPGGSVPSTGTGTATHAGATGNTVAALPCFAAGTALLTPRGPVPVELLAVGDPVVTRARAGCFAAPIRWIGRRRVDLRAHPDPVAVHPVRIRRGAVAPGVPVRDLLLSPDHAVFLGGVLIPVKYLLNGRTIVQQRGLAEILYVHIELDRHDVVLAEALPVETYLDTGNRAAFADGGGPVALHPYFAPRSWTRDACAPLTGGGDVVAAVRMQLAVRATLLNRPDARAPCARGVPAPRSTGSRSAVPPAA